MLVRTCPYDKSDGTLCDSPVVRGYDGCYYHSRVLQCERDHRLAVRLLLAVEDKLTPRMLKRIATELGVEPFPFRKLLPPIASLELGPIRPRTVIPEAEKSRNRSSLGPTSAPPILIVPPPPRLLSGHGKGRKPRCQRLIFPK